VGNPQSGEPDFSHGAGGGQRQTSMSREEADTIFKIFFGGSEPFANLFGGHETGSHFVFQTTGPSNSTHGFHGFPSCDTGFIRMNSGSAFPRSSSAAGTARFGAPRAHASGARTRSRRANSRQQKGARQHLVPRGSSVVIQGLTNSPHHNGKVGHIGEWDEIKGRYEVELRMGNDDLWIGDDKLWLRPQNVTQLCSVEVTGLVNKPELNGRSGDIFNYDRSKNRYMVLLDVPGSALSLHPGNCILKPGTSIVMDGLSRPECNGQKLAL